jgi:uncharacterized protein YndB with AHSA1/START domain
LSTDTERLIEWIAPVADPDARPGARVSWTHANGDSVRGEFVELVPGRRVVFTCRWEREGVVVPPGSTVVEIDLELRLGPLRRRQVSCRFGAIEEAGAEEVSGR